MEDLEDVRYVRSTVPDFTFAMPGLGRWLHHVWVVTGGFMAATGVLSSLIGYDASRGRSGMATGIVLAVAGLLSVVTMSAVNFLIRSAFKWVLLIPALLWVVAIVLYVIDR